MRGASADAKLRNRVRGLCHFMRALCLMAVGRAARSSTVPVEKLAGHAETASQLSAAIAFITPHGGVGTEKGQ